MHLFYDFTFEQYHLKNKIMFLNQKTPNKMNILTGKMGASPAFSGVKYCLAQNYLVMREIIG